MLVVMLESVPSAEAVGGVETVLDVDWLTGSGIGDLGIASGCSMVDGTGASGASGS